MESCASEALREGGSHSGVKYSLLAFVQLEVFLYFGWRRMREKRTQAHLESYTSCSHVLSGRSQSALSEMGPTIAPSLKGQRGEKESE